MGRRDVIIIAVLLNAGLLIALFATSVKTDKVAPPVVQVVASNYPQGKDVSPQPSLTSKDVTEDSIDRVVKQYVTPQIIKESPFESRKDGGQNFLADLDVVGKIETKESMQAIAQKNNPVHFYKEIKIQQGDSLEKIATQYQVSVADLIELNQLSSSQIWRGQVLKVPSKRERGVEDSTKTAQFYTIKSGDSPWSIAVKHKIKVEELLKLNNIDDAKARRLKPGEQIRIK
jgi:peptidoglycan DL-endopeptidase LytF